MSAALLRAGSDADPRTRRPRVLASRRPDARDDAARLLLVLARGLQGALEPAGVERPGDDALLRRILEGGARVRRVEPVGEPVSREAAAGAARDRRQHAAPHARRTGRAARTPVAAALEDRGDGLPHVGDGAATPTSCCPRRNTTRRSRSTCRRRGRCCSRCRTRRCRPPARRAASGKCWRSCARSWRSAQLRAGSRTTATVSAMCTRSATSGAASRSTAPSPPTRSAVSEMVADAVEVGNLPAGTTLETFRQQGYTRYAQWGLPRARHGAGLAVSRRRDARAAARSRRTRPSLPDAHAPRAVPDRPSLVPRRRRRPARPQGSAGDGRRLTRSCCRADTRAGACTR